MRLRKGDAVVERTSGDEEGNGYEAVGGRAGDYKGREIHKYRLDFSNNKYSFRRFKSTSHSSHKIRINVIGDDFDIRLRETIARRRPSDVLGALPTWELGAPVRAEEYKAKYMCLGCSKWGPAYRDNRPEVSKRQEWLSHSEG
jgi:hypothetical protein